MQDGIVNGIILDDLGGVIRGPVVHHQHFGIPILPLYMRENLLDRAANAHTFVICRDDDAVLKRQG